MRYRFIDMVQSTTILYNYSITRAIVLDSSCIPFIALNSYQSIPPHAHRFLHALGLHALIFLGWNSTEMCHRSTVQYSLREVDFLVWAPSLPLTSLSWVESYDCGDMLF